MTASQTHIDMLPKLPEGFAWEVKPPITRHSGFDYQNIPAKIAITHWVEPGPWKLPDQPDLLASYGKMSHRLPRDEEFYDYALKVENGTLRRCTRRDATHYRDNGKRIAKDAALTDLWTPDELISVGKDLYELWQIRLAQEGLYGTYPPKEQEA